MARGHNHHSGNTLMLDTLAAHNGLLSVSPMVKTAFCVVCLVLCVSAADLAVGVFVAVSMVLIMRLLGKISLHKIFHLLRIPLVFLIVSCVIILLEPTQEPLGLWHIPFGRGNLCVTRESLCHAVTLFFQAMGAVCCLYALSSSTPVPQLMDVFRRCCVPELVIELMYLIYRYLFLLLDVQQKLTIAASARLGYCGLKRSATTAGRISGTLLASSFRRSSQCYDAMESRCYDGKLRFLSHMPPVQAGHALAAGAYVLVLVGFIVFRKGLL